MDQTTLRIAFAAVLVGLGATGAQAQSCPPDLPCPGGGSQSVTPVSDVVNFTDVTWNQADSEYQDLTVPKVVLGANQSLLYVDITFKITVGGPITIENLTNNTCDIASDLTVTPTAQFSGIPISINIPQLQFALPINQIGPNDTESFNPPAQVAQGCTRITSAAQLPNFIGPGTVTVTHASSATGGCVSQACGGNIDCNLDLAASLELSIRYVLCEAAPPPPGDCPCIRDPRSPSSLLLFPEFTNKKGNDTLVTITNANCFNCTNDFGLPPEVIVEVVFIDKVTCLEDNFNVPLTPCDTFSFLTRSQTGLQQGYIYAFAKNNSGQAISFNHLVGQEIILDGFRNLDWSVNAAGFRAIPSQGQPTDIDFDNVRDLDNAEYIAAPERIIIPRFLGQDPFPNFFAEYRSTLTFINLSGGVQFRTLVDLSIWNDSEECFSRQWEFRCWDKQFLADISNVFTESFLDSTNDDPLEIIGWTSKEAGWLYIDGRNGFSGVESIDNPAIYALLVEEKAGRRVADLPWEEGCQENGDLLPVSILGDPRPGFPGGQNGDDQ